MTKFNQALLAAASSVALFGGALAVIAPEPAHANLWSCDSLGGYTQCYGSNGSTLTQDSFGGHSTGSYTDGYGNYSTYSCDSFGGYTTCSGY